MGYINTTHTNDGAINNLKNRIGNLENNSLSIVQLSGESGLLTDEQMAKVFSKSIEFLLGGRIYKLNEIANNYNSYINIAYPTIDTQETKVIYVNTSEGAVNYGRWNVEIETPNFEITTNKTTIINSSSTDIEYPSTKAVNDFVNSSINNIASFYITKNASGDPFATYNELISASTFYSGGQVRTPTRNDYCIVVADTTKANIVSTYTTFTTTSDYVNYYVIYNNVATIVTTQNKDNLGIVPGTTVAYLSIPTTRYTYQAQWEYQYKVNDTPFTESQLKAINSGITSALVNQITTNKNNIDGLINGTISIENAENANSATKAYQDEDGNNIKSTYATKVVNATSGNFASLDIYGNLVDSGISENDLPMLPTTVNNRFLHTNSSTGELEWAEALQDTATGVYSLTILGNSTSRNCATNVGVNSTANGYRATAYGCDAQVTAQEGIALGYSAKTTAQGAIQIGEGINSTQDTTQIGVHTILNNDTGKIPNARLDIDNVYSSTSQKPQSGIAIASAGFAFKPIIDTDDETSSVSLTLVNNTIYRYIISTGLTNLTLSLPTIVNTFNSEIVFKSGSTATVFSSVDIDIFSGDDVTSNVFTPLANKTYDILIYFDGINVNAIIKGV